MVPWNERSDADRGHARFVIEQNAHIACRRLDCNFDSILDIWRRIDGERQ
jgi:hypothetical protein